MSVLDEAVRQRAESGDPHAQMNLAVLLDNRGEHAPALEWLRRAADQGYGPAQHALGARLLVGRAAPYDPDRGAQWVAAAARQQLPPALALMGVLASLSGDWAMAIQLTREAADRGDAIARGVAAIMGDPKQFDTARWNRPAEQQWHFESPRVGVAEGFIPPAFCRWIIERARPKLEAVRVKDPMQGGAREADYRTNAGAGFSLIESDLILQLVNARVAGTIGVPLANQEPTNVLHYKPGEEYRPHCDFITPSPQHAVELEAAGQRTTTVLIYLNDDYEGGETDFPQLGWRFRGKAGDALIFRNLTPEGAPDPQSLHAGLPPTRGEKWLYSKWVRAKGYPLI